MDLKFIQIGAGPANVLGEAVWIIIGLITILQVSKICSTKKIRPESVLRYSGVHLVLFVHSEHGFRRRYPERLLS